MAALGTFGCGGGDGDDEGIAAGGAASGEGGGETLPLSREERCEDPGTLGCRPEDGAPSGTSFEDEDWTITYRGIEVEREQTGDPTNSLRITGHAFFDVTNEGDAPRELAPYEADLRFEAFFSSGSRSIATCDPGSQVPTGGAIGAGETMTLHFCFGSRGPEQFYEEPLTLSLRAPCLECSTQLAVDDQLPDGDVVTDVFGAIEAAADNADIDPEAGGYRVWVDRTGGDPSG